MSLEAKYQIFISDVIECNTEDCLIAFREYIGLEGAKNISDIWVLQREIKLLEHIASNFETLKIKYKMNLGENVLEEVLRHVDSNDDSKLDYQGNKGRLLQEELYEFQDLNSKEFFSNKAKSNLNVKPYYAPTLVDPAIIREFVELSFPQLNGEYIRNYLYEEYMKERTPDDQSACA